MSESLQCPQCWCKESRVQETRRVQLAGHVFTIRVRICRHCELPFRTKEVTVADEEAPLPGRGKQAPQSEGDDIPTVYNPFTDAKDTRNNDEKAS